MIHMQDHVHRDGPKWSRGPSHDMRIPVDVSTASLLIGGWCLGSKTMESHRVIQSHHLASSNFSILHDALWEGKAVCNYLELG